MGGNTRDGSTPFSRIGKPPQSGVLRFLGESGRGLVGQPCASRCASKTVPVPCGALLTLLGSREHSVHEERGGLLGPVPHLASIRPCEGFGKKTSAARSSTAKSRGQRCRPKAMASKVSTRLSLGGAAAETGTIQPRGPPPSSPLAEVGDEIPLARCQRADVLRCP